MFNNKALPLSKPYYPNAVNARDGSVVTKISGSTQQKSKELTTSM